MNLREAILYGARRTNAQWARMTFLHRRRSSDGGEPWGMCALTAAYYGCHPDEEPRPYAGEQVQTWAHNYVPGAGMVMGVNDASSTLQEIRKDGREWETLCDVLHRNLRPDGTPLDKVEVCDESA